MSDNKVKRVTHVSNVRITKAEIQATLDSGITHVRFHNKAVNKRLLKNQALVRREQELKERLHRKEVKERMVKVLAAVEEDPSVLGKDEPLLSQE